MKTKLFSSKLYKEALRQLRLPGISLFAILILTSILIPIGYMLTSRPGATRPVTISIGRFAPLISGYMFIAPFLLTIILFNFLNKRNKSDFYHALPHNRYSVFISFFTAILTVLYLSILVTVLTCGFLFSIADVVYPPYTMLYVTLSHMAGATLVAAATAIGIFLTGTFVSNASVTMLALFLPRILTTAVMGVTVVLVKLVSGLGNGLLGNVAYNIPANLIVGTIFNNNYSYSKALSFVGGIVYTFILSLIYIGIAALLFKRRKSETAEKSSPSTKLQHTYRCLVTLPFAIGITSTLLVSGDPIQDLKDNTILYITFIVICLLIYYLYEIITTKKWGNLVKATPVLLVLIGLNILFVLAVFANKAYLLSFSPDANKLQWISLERDDYYNYYGIGTNSYGNKVIENIKFEEQEIKEIVAKALDRTINLSKRDKRIRDNAFSRHHRVTFNIKSKGNFVKSRLLLFNDVELFELQTALNKNPEYFEIVTKLPADEHIDNKHVSFHYHDSYYDYNDEYGPLIEDTAMDELFEIFKEEYNKLPQEIQELIAHTNPDMYFKEYYSITEGQKSVDIDYYFDSRQYASIVLTGSYEGEFFSNSYFITKHTPKSYQYVLNKVMEKTREGALKEIQSWPPSITTWVEYNLATHTEFEATNRPILRMGLTGPISEYDLDKIGTILNTIRGASMRAVDVQDTVYSFVSRDTITADIGILYFNLTEDEYNTIYELQSNPYK